MEPSILAANVEGLEPNDVMIGPGKKNVWNKNKESSQNLLFE